MSKRTQSVAVNVRSLTCRKLVLADHNKDRAEDKASRCEEKIRRLQEELQSLNKGVSSLAASGERAAEMDDDVQDKIREIKKTLVLIFSSN